MVYNPSTGDLTMTRKVKPLPLEGGGYFTRIKSASNGDKITSCDTNPGYYRKAADSEWTMMLVQGFNIPEDSIDFTYWKGGTYDSAIHPTNPAIQATFHRGFLWWTNNYWAPGSVVKTAYPAANIGGNEGDRTQAGHRMLFDPADPTGYTMYFADPRADANGGLYRTKDRWATRRKVAGIATSLADEKGFIATRGAPGDADYHSYSGAKGTGGLIFDIDPTGGATSGWSQRVAVSSQGNGVHLITGIGDAAETVTQVSATLKLGIDLKYAPNGKLYYAGADTGVKLTAGAPYVYTGGNWTKITNAGANTTTIVPHDSTANLTYFVEEGGNILATTDAVTVSRFHEDSQKSRSAPNSPWAQLTNQSFMAQGGACIDPTDHSVWVSDGIGTWRTGSPLPVVGANTGIVWEWKTAGARNLIGMDITSYPDKTVGLGSQDRPVAIMFSDDLDNPKRVNVAPDASVGPAAGKGNTPPILHTQKAPDYCATDPALKVAACTWSVGHILISRDGFKTCQAKGLPTAIRDENGVYGGGNLVITGPTNLIWVPNNNSKMMYSDDLGDTWAYSQFAGHGSMAGIINQYYNLRNVLHASKTTPGKAWVYVFTGNPSTTDGYWETTDHGHNWTKIFAGYIGTIAGGNSARISINPANEAQRFFTPGDEDGAANNTIAQNSLLFSNDTGRSWNTCPGAPTECHSITFLTPFPGETIRIQAHGWVGTQMGRYECRNFNPSTRAGTWTLIEKAPLGSTDAIWVLAGDISNHNCLMANPNQTGAYEEIADIRACG